jgi:hypothetical protein
MSPLSSPVLGGAALVSSPAWWNVLNGNAPASVGLTRFLVSMAICWLALEVVAAFVGPAPRPALSEAHDAPREEPADPGAIPSQPVS